MTSQSSLKLINKVRTLDPASKLLEQLYTRADNPDTPPDVRATIGRALELIDTREEYSREMTYADSPGARMICEKTYAMPWQQLYKEGKVGAEFSALWLSGTGEGQILQFLIRMQKAKRVLEIGMFTGYVAMAMAEALPEDGSVVTCEFEPYLVEIARKWFDETPPGKRIDIRQGPALDSLDQLAAEGQTFDVVYLDADKPNYTAYFKKLLDLDLLAAGGTLMVDNSLYYGYPYTQPGSTVDLFNKAVMEDSRVEQIVLPLFDGVSLIRRKGE
ncbi:uncharacterized protein [Haliotis cracherodii]|uniref:uncharacterized protein n=1 Tax=Haliotis cracherodii TaxID=6455 RepID=UPI0039E72E71